MKRSYEGRGYAHEELLLAAEEAAFRQATLISVVSDRVAEDVAQRGIPPGRILVNPNAVDLEAYAPATPEQARQLRADLGFAPHHRVVGFIGTFGGWHGVEVLAQALPAIVNGDERIRVLLIGDGNLKHMVRDAVAASGIGDRVVDVGRVPQERGAELLKACDILVSPHSRHMVDSPFFGSPTKLFEYMAMGAGIVASDLEQIGRVLSPALTYAEVAAAHLAGRPIDAGQRRAVLCKPGDVAEFTGAVLALARDPALCAALGRNARAAAERYYTWDHHVRNLWLKLCGRPAEGYASDWGGGGE
jgi:glycosyltransferase involved in cell wall biosynthesis